MFAYGDLYLGRAGLDLILGGFIADKTHALLVEDGATVLDVKNRICGLEGTFV